MFSIILRSFNLVGPVITEKIEKSYIVNGRTDIADLLCKVIGDDLMKKINEKIPFQSSDDEFVK